MNVLQKSPGKQDHVAVVISDGLWQPQDIIMGWALMQSGHVCGEVLACQGMTLWAWVQILSRTINILSQQSVQDFDPAEQQHRFLQEGNVKRPSNLSSF